MQACSHVITRVVRLDTVYQNWLFATVSHSVLMVKMKKAAVCCLKLYWMIDWLTDRLTVVGDIFSPKSLMFLQCCSLQRIPVWEQTLHTDCRPLWWIWRLLRRQRRTKLLKLLTKLYCFVKVTFLAFLVLLQNGSRRKYRLYFAFDSCYWNIAQYLIIFQFYWKIVICNRCLQLHIYDYKVLTPNSSITFQHSC